MKTFDNIHAAYQGVLKDVYFEYDYRAAPRGQPVREKLDYSFRITNPKAEAIVTKDLERNKTIAAYTASEQRLYDSCTNDVEDFAKASKFWRTIANPDGTVNSAYGYLIWKNKSHGSEKYEGVMRTPWEWAKESLIADKDTRQALLRFSLPEHQFKGNKDQTCTLSGNFLIRENRLHLSVVMRSNDLVLGLAYDLPWFISLIDRMVEELRPTYPTLEKGTYTHTVHSLHIYERDEDRVLKMIGETPVERKQANA